ncbi:hypothetical protein ACFL34_05535, partial [Candidatus Sumerlaeota bacterium]
YRIAITKEPLESKKPGWEDVVYIGMTNSQRGLISRWRQFDRAICQGVTGYHSGGKSLSDKHGKYGGKKWCESGYHLYVSAIGIECNTKEPTEDDYLAMGLVACLEYWAFGTFCRAARKRGAPVKDRHPMFNTQ